MKVYAQTYLTPGRHEVCLRTSTQHQQDMVCAVAIT